MRKVIDEADLIGILQSGYALRGWCASEFFVALNFNGRSSRFINLVSVSPLKLWIFNFNDGTDNALSGNELIECSTMEALRNGALYWDDEDLLRYSESRSKIVNIELVTSTEAHGEIKLVETKIY